MTETKMQLEDWLDDLCVRFIINLPREELESVERICFQVEEAQWFYEDFIRPLDPALPSLNLKTFAMRIFQHCPLMSNWSHQHHIAAFSEFLAYKTRVPVRGAIMLNQDMDEVVLVKGWKKGANWSFPRGKINKGEKDLDCAIREVYEETGFDVRAANLIKNDDDVKNIEVTMREQHMQLFVFRGVPRDTYFEPRTRKEISKIEWYKLADLPTMRKNRQQDEGYAAANANKFYMVAPFLHPLKKWIAQQKKLDLKAQPAAKQAAILEGYTSVEENGYANGTPGMSLAEVARPSDLPEVASSQDASDHLKRLLKIGGMPSQMQEPVSEPGQHPAVDASKSDALLALLLQGKAQQVAPHVSHNDATPLPHGAQPNLLHTGHAIGPNFFPGFPQQQQTPHFLPGHAHIGLQYPSNGPSIPSQAGFSNVQPDVLAAPPMPHFSQTPPVSQYPVPQGHMPAPFQRTGDPQFSESGPASRSHGPAVPPASKLPPPKLTTHSLALLNAFKVQTPKGPGPATLAAPVQDSPHVRKTSQHQDGLLNLLKGPQSLASSQPVELSGNPVVPSPAPPSKQILQRPQNHYNSPAQYSSAQPHSHITPGQVSATVYGTAGASQPETTTKPTHKSNGGSSRRNPASRREQNPTPPTSSPMTILSRPQSAKREVPHRPLSRTTSIPPAQAPQAPEPVKNFQPQILRRSDKTGYEELMAAAPHSETPERKPSLPGPQHSQGLAPQGNFDRRPSQTAEQKASLLSLFAKGDGLSSPKPAGSAPLDSRAAYQQPNGPPGFVSPMSSRYHPSSGGTISRHGTPSDGGAQAHTTQVSSPSNKAFLLGFLEGVAKGNK
ncbi:mRNA decapping protein 2 Box A [Penicillium brevicompactum]|uniref:mRNA decapping protein 2 Box A n=1 Tax=Penicillium brevicompactum TaxID=5074 RepID=A0A9W9Q7I0_PENBR|nr:mRNA decapping protein 2 Box A [Penicillium brevicompactum]